MRRRRFFIVHTVCSGLCFSGVININVEKVLRTLLESYFFDLGYIKNRSQYLVAPKEMEGSDAEVVWYGNTACNTLDRR